MRQLPSALALAAVSVCSGAVGQPKAVGAQELSARLVLQVDPERGGPERIPNALAVSPRGLVAFTFGYDDGDHHVTVMDSVGSVVTRVGTTGSGPAEFRSVLRVHLLEDAVLLFGVGQISAFSLRGRHLWSRAISPYQMPVGWLTDSVDLHDVRYWADGRGVGATTRQSLTRGGGARVLLPESDGQLRAMARSVEDSGRFARVTVATSAELLVVAHPHTSQIVAFATSGQARRVVSNSQAPRYLTSREIDAATEAFLERTRRPYRLPDGTFTRITVPRSVARERFSGPQPAFHLGGGGVNVDAQSGDVFVFEANGASTRLVRYGTTATASVTLPCDLASGTAAIAWPFAAVTCNGEVDGEPAPVLQLYRLR